jgi:hypothetical protein
MPADPLRNLLSNIANEGVGETPLAPEQALGVLRSLGFTLDMGDEDPIPQPDRPISRMGDVPTHLMETTTPREINERLREANLSQRGSIGAGSSTDRYLLGMDGSTSSADYDPYLTAPWERYSRDDGSRSPQLNRLLEIRRMKYAALESRRNEPYAELNRLERHALNEISDDDWSKLHRIENRMPGWLRSTTPERPEWHKGSPTETAEEAFRQRNRDFFPSALSDAFRESRRWKGE